MSMSIMDATHLVRVAANSGDALDPEVERLRWVTGCLEERHDEAAKAAVDVKSDAVLGREFAKSDDVVLASVREIDSRSYELKCSYGEVNHDCN